MEKIKVAMCQIKVFDNKEKRYQKSNSYDTSK